MSVEWTTYITAQASPLVVPRTFLWWACIPHSRILNIISCFASNEWVISLFCPSPDILTYPGASWRNFTRDQNYFSQNFLNTVKRAFDILLTVGEGCFWGKLRLQYSLLLICDFGSTFPGSNSLMGVPRVRHFKRNNRLAFVYFLGTGAYPETGEISHTVF